MWPQGIGNKTPQGADNGPTAVDGDYTATAQERLYDQPHGIVERHGQRQVAGTAVEQPGLYEAGAYVGHADIDVAYVRELVDGLQVSPLVTLGSRISRRDAEPLDTGHRGDGGDAAGSDIGGAAVVQERRVHDPGETGHVRGYRTHIVGGVEPWIIPPAPGGVEHDVHASDALDEIKEVSVGIFGRHVEGGIFDAARIGLGELAQRFLAARCDTYAPAAARESLGDGAADTRRGSNDDDVFRISGFSRWGVVVSEYSVIFAK